MLSSDFEVKSQEKLRLLLQREDCNPDRPSESTVTVASEPSAPVEPSAPTEPTVPPSVEVEAESLVVNDKLVKLTDLSGRKTVLKDAPANLESVTSEEDLPKFSLEALKRLAKSAALEHAKQINKPALVALLVDAHRKVRAQSAPEETASLR